MTIVLSTPPYQQFFDDNGDPLSGGLVYTYASGTTTPRETYTDQGGGTPNANPVVLDSAGRAAIWLDNSAAYKFVVKTSTGTTIRTTDVVTPFNTASGLSVLGTIAANTIVGNNTGSTATPSALTATQAQANMISNLSVITPDAAADYVAFYDASGATAGKALINTVSPPLTGRNVLAWVNFNGTGTPAIQGQYNVASITDNGVGDYTVNFTSSLAASTYCLTGTAKDDGNESRGTVTEVSRSTSSVRVKIIGNSTTAFDSPSINVLIIGT